jgi:hypothetical protein
MPVFATDTIWPAIWSAVAATFSGLTALCVLLVHLWNRADSVRPEVLLEEWDFSLKDSKWANWSTIRVRRIRNVGNGAALHVRTQLVVPGKAELGPPIAMAMSDPLAFFPPGETMSVEWLFHFDFDQAAITFGGQTVYLHLEVWMADSHGRQLVLTYDLVATKHTGVGGALTLVPGLDQTRRWVRTTPTLRRLAHRLRGRIEHTNAYRRWQRKQKSK